MLSPEDRKQKLVDLLKNIIEENDAWSEPIIAKIEDLAHGVVDDDLGQLEMFNLISDLISPKIGAENFLDYLKFIDSHP